MGPGGAGQAPQGNITLVIVALVMGFIAVVVTNLYVNQVLNRVDAKMIKIYRLNKKKEVGEKLNAKRDLVATRVPAEFRTSFPGFVDDPEKRDGDTLTRPVKRNAVLVKDMFVSLDGEGEPEVPPGHAVKTISVDRDNLSDTIGRNDIVDVYASFKTEGRAKPMKVLSRVKVLRRGNNQVDLLLTTDAVEELMAVESFFSFDRRKGFELVGLPREEGVSPWAGTGVNPAVLRLIRYK